MKPITAEERYAIFGKAILSLHNNGVGVGGAVIEVCKKLVIQSDEEGRIRKCKNYASLAKELDTSVSTVHKVISSLMRYKIIKKEEGDYYIIREGCE